MWRDPTQPLGNQKALGQAIRTMREESEGLTPELLAKRAEVDLQTLTRIEAGEGDADYNTLRFIVRAMDRSMGGLGDLHESSCARKKVE